MLSKYLNYFQVTYLCSRIKLKSIYRNIKISSTYQSKILIVTQSIVTTYIKKQESMTYNEEKNKSIKIDPEIIQVIKLEVKDIETVNINYKLLFLFNKLEKSLKMLSRT